MDRSIRIVVLWSIEPLNLTDSYVWLAVFWYGSERFASMSVEGHTDCFDGKLQGDKSCNWCIRMVAQGSLCCCWRLRRLRSGSHPQQSYLSHWKSRLCDRYELQYRPLQHSLQIKTNITLFCTVGNTDAQFYVDFVLSRARGLREQGVEPVFVFDGKRNNLKVLGTYH